MQIWTRHLSVSVCMIALSCPAFAGSEKKPVGLADRLTKIRTDVIRHQKELIDGLRNQQAARYQISKIQVLLKLQDQERELGKTRISELEVTVGELENRRGMLREKISVAKKAIRMHLLELNRAEDSESLGLFVSERDEIEQPRLRVMAGLTALRLKEVAAIKVDMEDADQLELKIEEERQQLTYLFQDLKEQQSILELNRQLQSDMLRKEYQERLTQLEGYRKLKLAESQVEQMIGEFSARRELEQMVESERAAARAHREMTEGIFVRLKGQLPLPVTGQVVSSFGRSFDPVSRLYVFKKGIDVMSGKGVPVKAVSAGKVAYSGTLQNYGRVAIVDHGDHFYSLCAHLGTLQKKAGDPVVAGDILGMTDDQGTPVYFEIRSRNIAVNPLQWVSN